MNDKQISLKMPQDLYHELDLLAKEKGLGIATYIRMVLKESVSKIEDEKLKS